MINDSLHSSLIWLHENDQIALNVIHEIEFRIIQIVLVSSDDVLQENKLSIST